jgi:hypothetical protein
VLIFTSKTSKPHVCGIHHTTRKENDHAHRARTNHDTEQDPLGDLDADDLRRTSGLIRHVRPVTQPG